MLCSIRIRRFFWTTFASVLGPTNPCSTAVGTEPFSPSVFEGFRAIDLMSRMFANGPRDRSSIPGRIITKTQKMVLDTALLITQRYKVQIKSKVQQSME